jgi:hypothetical protein
VKICSGSGEEMPMTELRYTLAVAAMLFGSAFAQEPTSSLGSRLPANVRVLLIEEMNAIMQASHTILEAIVRGQHEVVAEQAARIHDSFILEQRMTSADRAALEEAATPSFIQQDEAFHALADRLAQAAVQRDHAEERRLFAQMLDACAACHAEHAGERFPGVRSDPRATPDLE